MASAVQNAWSDPNSHPCITQTASGRTWCSAS